MQEGGEKSATDDGFIADDEEVFDEDEPEPQTQFSEEVNALAHLSKDDIASLTREVDELSDVSSGSSENETERMQVGDDKDEDSDDKEELGCSDDPSLRQQVLGLSSPETSSDESMSGDYPQGWKPKSRSSSSEHLHLLDIDDPTEAKLELYQAARTSDDFLFEEESNSRTERSEDSDDASCDDELAAIVERGFLS